MFDQQLARFLEDLGTEILSTPTGPDRELLTDAQINLMRIQDARKEARRES